MTKKDESASKKQEVMMLEMKLSVIRKFQNDNSRAKGGREPSLAEGTVGTVGRKSSAQKRQDEVAAT